MKFKKISSLFLAVTIASSAILTGCSSTKKSDEAKKGNGDNVELVWYMIGTPQPDQAKVMEEVNKYTAEKIGVTLDLRMVDWGDYGQKMQVITSSGEPFDIAFASDYALNAQKGAYLEISDLLEKNGKELKEAINPLFLEGASINGKLYGVPANKEVGQQMVWAYNADMAKEIGVDMTNVKTLEDLEKVLEVVKAKKPDLKMPMSAGSTFVPYMPYDLLLGENLPFGIALEGDTTKVVNIYEQKDVKKTLDTLRRFYQKGFIHTQASTDTDPHEMSVQNWFVRKEQYAPGAGEMWSSNAGYPIKYSEMHDPLTINNSVTGSVMSISAASKHPEEAMKFLNLLNTDEYLRNLIDRGIEDVHYKTNEDKTITKTEEAKAYNMPSWALGNVFLTKNFDTDPKDRIEQYEKFNEKAVASPTLGFYVDTTDISTELATISNIVQEFKAPLFTGSVDTDKYLGELNKKLKSAGIDKVMANIQEQYNKWMADQKK
ncbi:ABC transporter substrate-binding protein [Clostridium sp. CCUG 7971]|uniref:ABC transporter substrate-binding protein n=1 Tax=Clostridium sp. CCUG 7971 TaxID=2811414 RepID=UPI001ABA7010|nr:ABC transporter substrate-binding protein [Clostridium sp. CCUG 7971]MBO3443182.1 ABC transporter substrate-binding protein [Clostridium sp. CCUG 7971]